MKTFGAELVGNQRTFPRTRLLQQLKKHRGRAAFRVEEERRARLVAELQQARLTGVRFKVPAETMSAKLANLPEGVSVARGRIEVRFDGAEDALERLFALAKALGNDYDRFEALVGRRGGGGEVVGGMTTEALDIVGVGVGDRDGWGRRGDRPAAGDRRGGAGGGGEVPGILRGADREREDVGGVRAGGGAIPRVVRGARPRAPRRLPAPRGRLHPNPPGIGADGEAAPGRDPHARRLACRQPGPPGEPPPRPCGGRSCLRPRRGSSSRRSTGAPWSGSGIGRCCRSCSTASRG